MKRLLVCAACLAFLSSGVVLAQQPADPATKEDMQKLFELTQPRKTMDTMADVMKQQVPAMVGSLMDKEVPNPTPEEKARMQEFLSGLYGKMFASMPIDEMMEAMIPVYQRHFSHAEVEGLIQFYSTPIGQKMLHEMPAVVSEAMVVAMPVMQKWMGDIMTDMQKQAAEFAKNMRKQPPAPAKPNAS